MDLFRRLFFAAVLAGVVGGLVNAGLQHWRLVPLILQAEVFEQVATLGEKGKESHDTGSDSDGVHSTQWSPEDGLERTGFTLLASILAGIGFAAILNGVSVVAALPLTTTNGLLWGLAGFAVFSLAPALGLAPELPGMGGGDLGARQTWWWFTALATAAALIGMAKVRRPLVFAAGAVLIVLPHLVGAPVSIPGPSGVSPELASAFATNALGVALIIWLLTGQLLGWLNARLARRC